MHHVREIAIYLDDLIDTLIEYRNMELA